MNFGSFRGDQVSWQAASATGATDGWLNACNDTEAHAPPDAPTPISPRGQAPGSGAPPLFTREPGDGSLLLDSRSSITNTVIITYTYDPLYRLTGAEYDNGMAYLYEYDAVGNRTQFDHCLEGFGCNTTTYTYDIANRLASVDDGTGVITFQWDARIRIIFSEPKR